jgi:hypothetical protein
MILNAVSDTYIGRSGHLLAVANSFPLSAVGVNTVFFKGDSKALVAAVIMSAALLSTCVNTVKPEVLST